MKSFIHYLSGIGTAALLVVFATAHAQSTASVSMANFAFTPQSITVQAGTTVTWTNNDTMVHTVTADDGSFDSGTIGTTTGAKTYSHTFSTPGTYPYHCAFHGGAGGVGMSGTVTVTAVSGGGGTTGGQCTNFYDGTQTVANGWGAAYDLFNSPFLKTVNVDCTGASPKVNYGSGLTTQYIYNVGYLWASSSTAWQPLTITSSSALQGDVWYTANAQANMSVSASDLANWNYVIGYICNYVTPAGTTTGAWKCGCHDTTCATGLWQIQAFKR